jgi:hypothetical protein
MPYAPDNAKAVTSELEMSARQKKMEEFLRSFSETGIVATGCRDAVDLLPLDAEQRRRTARPGLLP